MLADGGAIADWTLVADWFVAVGTVGAVAVALTLGVRTFRDDARRQQRAQRMAAFQVVAVLETDGIVNGFARKPRIAIGNGTDSTIMQVDVNVVIDPDPKGALGWEWRWDHNVSQVAFVLPRQSTSLRGAAFPTSADEPDHSGEPVVAEWMLPTLRVTLTWTDAFGARWERVNISPPQLLSPGRD